MPAPLHRGMLNSTRSLMITSAASFANAIRGGTILWTRSQPLDPPDLQQTMERVE